MTIAASLRREAFQSGQWYIGMGKDLIAFFPEEYICCDSKQNYAVHDYKVGSLGYLYKLLF